MKEIIFKDVVVDLGVISPGSTHLIKWVHNGTPSDIYDVKASCSSCTRDIKMINNTVEATFTEREYDNLKIEGDYPFTKEVTAYLKDGLPMFVQGEVGRIYNPDKKKITLIFRGLVRK